MPARVLLVEDDSSLRDLICLSLGRLDVECDTVDTAEIAIVKVSERHYDAIVLDLMLPASSGLYVVDAIRRMPQSERPPIVLTTGASADMLKQVDRTIVKSIIFKPLDLDTFAPYVAMLANRSRTA